MKKIKQICNWFYEHKPKSTENKEDDASEKPDPYDHVLTIDGFESRESAKLPLAKVGKKSSRLTTCIMDFCFCTFVTLLWVTAYLIFIHFTLNSSQSKSQEKQIAAHEAFYFSYVIILVVVCVTGIYLETLVLRSFERYSPKIALVVKKSHGKGFYTLRMRVADAVDKEFIESEIQESELSYDTVLEICCKELELEKDNVMRLKKMPDTKIRSDDDVKRFRRLEYLEVVTKE